MSSTKSWKSQKRVLKPLWEGGRGSNTGGQVHGQAAARGLTGGVDVAEVLPGDGFLPASLPGLGEPLAWRPWGQQGPREERPISTPGSPQRGCPPPTVRSLAAPRGDTSPWCPWRRDVLCGWYSHVAGQTLARAAGFGLLVLPSTQSRLQHHLVGEEEVWQGILCPQ